MSSHGKNALVTGASRGIGALLALRLAADGFRTVVNYAGNAAAAQDVVNRIAQAGGEAIAAQADVADSGAVEAMFDSADKAFGGIDVVVNNAGIMKLAPIAQFSDQDFGQLVAINLKGTFNVCREAAKRVRDGGRIINVSSSVIGMRLPSLRALHRNESGRRRPDPGSRAGNAGARGHGECRGAGSCRHRPVSRRQDPGV